MKLSTFLQLFLLLDVFLIGAVASTAVRHAYAHFRPPKKADPAKSPTPSPGDVQLPAASREHLLRLAEANFQASLDHSATQLHHNLETTIDKLNKLVEHLGTEIIGNELERYRTELAQAGKQAEADMAAIRSEIAKHEDELKAKLAEDIETERQKLIQQIDTKLADAVGSFLVETLQHNVDLGAQSAYLTAVLEEHKADFVKGVGDEIEAAS